MTPEETFKYKYKQSYRILSALDIERLPDLSNYLRHMLLDGLIEQVNRALKLKITYTIGPVEGEMIHAHNVVVNGESVLSYADHPEAVGQPHSRVVRKDGFLAYSIVMTNSVTYTVKDVIDLCANKEGGVHSQVEMADGDRLRELRRLERAALIGGVRGAWRSLGVIGRITVESLEPLYSRLCWG